MTMRNAFGSLASEVTVSGIKASVENVGVTALDTAYLVQSLERLINAFARSQIQVPRDVAGRMRTTVDNSVNVNLLRFAFWDNGTYVPRYSSGGVNSIDAREQHSELVRANSISYRNRWSFS